MGEGDEKALLIFGRTLHYKYRACHTWHAHIIRYNNMKNVIKTFEDVNAFVRYLGNGTTQDGFNEHSHTGSEWFTGTESFEDAQRLLLHGDMEMAKKIEDGGVRATRNALRNSAPRRQLYSCVVGCAPNVPAFLSGAPNNMIAQKTTMQPRQSLSIIYNCTASGSEDKSCIASASASLLSAILMLENSGIRTELRYGVVAREKSGKRHQIVAMFVKVKNAQQHLDVTKTAYPLANPSMLRRHYFRYVEVTPGISQKYSSGYGCVVHDEDEILKVTEEAHLKHVVCISYTDIKYMSATEVLDLITEKAKAKK